MYKVAILLSSYNGELYIREQLDSILQQKNVQSDIYVRDDGSDDQTLQILKEYEAKYHFIVEFGDNLGVANSFMKLLYECSNDYDYYAFCDQDDIWKPEKLYKAIERIGDNKSPCLYASNQLLIDSQGGPMGVRYGTAPPVDYLQFIFKNYLAGCTMVFNRKLKVLLSESDRRPSEILLKNRMHDVWVALVASIVGTVIYDNNAYILYRQHETNVVGAAEVSFITQLKFKTEKLLNTEKRNGRSHTAKELYLNYYEYLNEKEETIDMLANYSDSLKSKFKLLRSKKILSINQETRIGIILKIVFNLF